MTLMQLGLPTNGSHVNVADLHPELRERLKRLIAASSLPIQVRSGARTFSHQYALYTQWVADGRPADRPVANPSYRWPDGRMGSAHQIQPAGGYKHGNLSNDLPWAYAVDLMWKSGYPTFLQQSQLRSEAAMHGLIANVPGEWWHYTPIKTWVKPAPPPPEEPSPPMAEITQREWRQHKAQNNQDRKRLNQLEARVAKLEEESAIPPVELIQPIVRAELEKLLQKIFE